MDRRNPHNSYYYKPLDQAAPIYIPPSKSTQRILPVPQQTGQTEYHYGRPGEASPVYIPGSHEQQPQSAKRAAQMKNVSLSDEHSKTQIRKLESTNEALMKALDTAHAETPEGNMPATEYPNLPSHTNFANTPAANKVAAQNVGIQAASAPPAAPAMPAPRSPPPPMTQLPPPPGMQPNPSQQNFARSQNPAFNVGAPMPDLSALDEAYKRQGMGG